MISRGKLFFMAIILLLIALAVLLWYTPADNKKGSETPPTAEAGISGVMFHDFGISDPDSGEALRHTFILKNNTGQAVKILNTSTTCGCTQVSIDHETIMPDELLSVTGTLVLSDSGEKVAQIFLQTDYPNRPVIVLTLKATGRRARTLMTERQYINISSGETEKVNIYYMEYNATDQPRKPQLTVPEGLSATFSDWRIIETADPAHDLPGLWEGTMSISAGDAWDDLSKAEVQVTMPAAEPLVITVH